MGVVKVGVSGTMGFWWFSLDQVVKLNTGVPCLTQNWRLHTGWGPTVS